jgi:phosphoribosylamine--glycine ligase
MERRAFGAAGSRVVVEEFMIGQEISWFVLSNGGDVMTLATAEDHKAVFDGDRGPNTGGMGCYSPVAVFDEALEKRVMETIVRPTLAALAGRGCPVSRRPLCGPHADGAGPESRRVQLPLRRSRVSGAHGAGAG